MDSRQKEIIKNVDRNRDAIIDALDWLWQHPQTGFSEWDANDYLRSKFEALGYNLTLAGNIPGFYTDIDTGIAGPKLCIIGEMDALDISNHPDSVNGMAHCCGHHAQSAALLGIAAALKEPGALDSLCGSIRLMAAPAEELIQLEYREELRRKGIIKYYTGKAEFMSRGFFDDVDLALMVHGNSDEKFDFTCTLGNNGAIAKNFTYRGVSSHAGGSPHLGVNAQYAALLGIQACNNLRETFIDTETIRFHPIMKGVNCAVNVIPDEIKLESFVRGRTMKAMKRENTKINRALTGAALSMGARLELCDRPGYFPELHDLDYMKLVEQCCCDLVGADRVDFDPQKWGTISSDFGDVTSVMPGIQFFASGAKGALHSTDYCVISPDRICLNSSKAQLFVADALLSNNAANARRIIKNYVASYSSIEAYLKDIDNLVLDKNAVEYSPDGSVAVDFQN